MTKTRLCIIFGGASSEHEVSCMSAASVIKNLNAEKYELFCLGILKDGRQFLYNGDTEKINDSSFAEDTEHLVPAIISPCPAHHGIMILNKAEGTFKIQTIDCFFPVVHGENCEDGNLQGLLKLSGVPFVGSDNRGSAVCMDKAITKTILETVGIPMADWRLFKEDYTDEDIAFCEEKLGYPMFVKPAGTGSSVGVSKVANREELICAVKSALRYDPKVLVEEYIKGAEIETAVLDTLVNGERVTVASRPGEIDPGSEFYDYDTKYVNDTTKYYLPARLPKETLEEVRGLAIKIFLALDCRGLSRVDFFASEKGIIFNEINTLPGFTKISMYPKLMNEYGIPYSELIDKLIDYAKEN
ncbi:MAG: D-alanine--D-alanine ligase [Ruminococcaceae bacterium]|nr:D-alanine--D-alanine ligase [Oscillospiraceae bacterium]